jgi:hypothetical protein
MKAPYELVRPEYDRAQKHLGTMEHNRRILAFMVTYGHPSHVGIVAEDVKDVQQRINMLRVAITRFEDIYGEDILATVLREVNG